MILFQVQRPKKLVSEAGRPGGGWGQAKTRDTEAESASICINNPHSKQRNSVTSHYCGGKALGTAESGSAGTGMSVKAERWIDPRALFLMETLTACTLLVTASRQRGWQQLLTECLLRSW
jgi:hypothetical protein